VSLTFGPSGQIGIRAIGYSWRVHPTRVVSERSFRIAKQATVVEPFAFELIDLVETIDSTCDTIGVILDGLASNRCS